MFKFCGTWCFIRFVTVLSMHSVCSFPTTVRIINQIQRITWLSGQRVCFLHKTDAIKPVQCSSSLILCTDSKRQGALNHKFQHDGDDGKGPEQEAMCIFLKDNVQISGSRYLKLTSLPHDDCNIEKLIQTKEFKSLLARSSFFYDVNLADNSQSYMPFSGVYYYSFEDICNSSTNHLKNKQSSDSAYQVLIGTSSDAKENDTGKPTEDQLLFVIDRLTKSLLSFFEKPHDFSIYHRNIIFQNNIKGVTIKGLNAYIQTMYLLRICGYVQYAKVKVEILKITHHIEDGSVRVRWRVNSISRHKVLMNFWKLKSVSWKQLFEKEAEWMDGFSVFSVGPDGLIYKHICDKMTPDDDTVASKKGDLKSRLLGLFELTPRGSAAGGLNTLIPFYRNQEFLSCKKLT